MRNLATPAGLLDPIESPLQPKLRSRVFGRERWDVPTILASPRAAGSLKALLESECGVRRVVANELTGRVLVEYAPGELPESVETLLHRALEFGPMSRSEFDAFRDPKPTGLPVVAAFASAELGCLCLKLLLFGVSCPCVHGRRARGDEGASRRAGAFVPGRRLHFSEKESRAVSP